MAGTVDVLLAVRILAALRVLEDDLAHNVAVGHAVPGDLTIVRYCS